MKQFLRESKVAVCWQEGTGLLFSLCSLGKEMLKCFSTTKIQRHLGGCRSWWDALSCLSLPPAQRSSCTAILPQRKVWRGIGRLFCWHYSRDLLDWSSPLATPQASETPPGCIDLKSASLSYWRSRSADGSGHDPEGYQELRYLPKLLQSKFCLPSQSSH